MGVDECGECVNWLVQLWVVKQTAECVPYLVDTWVALCQVHSFAQCWQRCGIIKLCIKSTND